jgi:hypothetical protein
MQITQTRGVMAWIFRSLTEKKIQLALKFIPLQLLLTLALDGLEW